MKDVVTTLSSSQKTASGTVKWFAPTKGYGFVVVPGFEEDFLLYANILRNFGRTRISEGAEISFVYDTSGYGYRITKIIDVEAVRIDEVQGDYPKPDFVCNDRVPARVKWYDPARGYGFVNAFGSLEDIFVGSSVLHRSALGGLVSGEAVCIQIAETEGRKSVFAVHDWV